MSYAYVYAYPTNLIDDDDNGYDVITLVVHFSTPWCYFYL